MVVTAEELSVLQHAVEDINVLIIIDVQLLEVPFLPKPMIMADCNREPDWTAKLDIQ